MFSSFYDEPQDSPNPEQADTLRTLIGRYVTNIELGTFITSSWM